MSSDGEDSALVQREIAGDAGALKLLLTESRPRLWEYIARRIPAELTRLIDADDLVQEVHIEVFRRIGSLDQRESGSFFSWVATIGANRLRDAIRKHQAEKRGAGADVVATARGIEDSTIALLDTLAGPGRTPSRSVARVEAIKAVHTALDELPEHYRRALWLVHLEGRPVREAAMEMDRTERAIHGLCRRGLKLLEDRIGSSTGLLGSSG